MDGIRILALVFSNVGLVLLSLVQIVLMVRLVRAMPEAGFWGAYRSLLRSTLRDRAFLAVTVFAFVCIMVSLVANAYGNSIVAVVSGGVGLLIAIAKIPLIAFLGQNVGGTIFGYYGKRVLDRFGKRKKKVPTVPSAK